MAFATAAACSSSTGGTAGPTAASLYAQQYCGIFASCCADAGLPQHPQFCEEAVAGGGAHATYDADAGVACLAALKERQSQPGFCAGLQSPKECDYVFLREAGAPPAVGTLQPGQACSLDTDCAAMPGGSAMCVYETHDVEAGSYETRTCVQTAVGGAGDTPCIGTTNTPSYLVLLRSQGPPPKRGFLCDGSQGLYCSPSTQTCVALSQVGQPCAGYDECVASAYCDFTSGKCAAPVAVGGTCAPATAPPCVSKSYCDPSKLICTAKLSDGAACAIDDSCSSGFCVNGACESSGDIGLSLQFFCGQ
jgi:hypothetical protein